MLQQLQQWYISQCDGEWEEDFGIRIETLDNPGWAVEIDLEDTSLAGVSYPPVKDLDPDDDWIDCEVRG
ncbi:MAG: Imm53 family immunity protein, partial [Gemmatimonadota bacterium]